MRKYENYDKVEAYTGEYEQLEPGGYVCRILDVRAEEKEYGTLLRIAFDIVEGEYKDYYKRQFERKKEKNPDAKWPGVYYQTVKEDKLGYFKGFITAIEKSNPGYDWGKSNWDEKTLKGKLFGGVFGEEEFERNDGSIGVIVRCRFIRSIDAIKEGVKIPERKKLNKSQINVFSKEINANEDDDLPVF